MASRRDVLALAAVWAALSLSSGCASGPTGRPDLLDFLLDGATRREDVVLRLGEPSTRFEGDRILAYRLARDDRGYVLVARTARWSGVRLNLMLAFDAEGVLRRHALIEVRVP